MLSVYFDFQILLAQKYGGISRYIYEIASRLPKFGAETTINCIHNHNYYFSDRLGLYGTNSNKILRLAELGTFFYANKLKAFFDLRRRKYDIVHPTYYYASRPKHGKFIVTVHDMTHEKYAGLYGLNRRLISAKKKIIHQADRLIAVSVNTKRDILEYYPDIDPAKIAVIYHGASMSQHDGSSGKFRHMDGQKYILFVGARGGYKNFTRFIEAMHKILDRHKELHVFCAGGGAFTDEEKRFFGEYASRIHQAGLSDEELADAYAGAECLVFPSEYEGFGIPIMEAFACGCPVVCSEASCFPEVADEAARYFDPLNPEDMSVKILEVLDDEALRVKLIASGRERLKIFDWDKAAMETLKCYKEAIEND